MAPFQTPAIIGAPSYRDDYQNRTYAVDGGASLGRYSKVRLVPFGEYFPLRRTLAFAYDLLFTTIGLPGLTSATPSSTFEPRRLGDIVAGTYICYESTFPSMAAGGANLLVNISNDAWLGRTQGAEQHSQMGRVRAGNDGITAVIDSRGRVVQRLPRGARDAYPVTVQLRSRLTPYVRWGDAGRRGRCRPPGARRSGRLTSVPPPVAPSRLADRYPWGIIGAEHGCSTLAGWMGARGRPAAPPPPPPPTPAAAVAVDLKGPPNGPPLPPPHRARRRVSMARQRDQAGKPHLDPGQAGGSALRVLRKRHARGEIDHDEYQARKQGLR